MKQQSLAQIWDVINIPYNDAYSGILTQNTSDKVYRLGDYVVNKQHKHT